MLAITETAATAIKSLAASTEQPEEAGVRITAEETPVDERGALKLSLADGPGQEDQVVDMHGAHVFLEPHVASYLDNKVLDAEIDRHQVRFAVSDQRPEPG